MNGLTVGDHSAFLEYAIRLFRRLGILATTFREYAASQTLDRKWILFDGTLPSIV
jgi:hypothetical protein